MQNFIFKFVIGTLFVGLLILAWAINTWVLSPATKTTSAKTFVEPTAEVVASGQCIVPVCTDVDLGDSYLRYYAAGVIQGDTTYIPKGACQCREMRKVESGLTGTFAIGYEVRSTGERVGGFIVPAKCEKNQTGRRSVNETTYERFLRLRSRYDEELDFSYAGESFPEFDVYKENDKKSGPQDHFFVPKKNHIVIAGKQQRLAFRSVFGLRNGPDQYVGRAISSVTRISDCVLFDVSLNLEAGQMSKGPARIEYMATKISEDRLFPKK